jgi:hypothetical protein
MPAAVSADAYGAAESSRDVSDPTSGTVTLTPGSVLESGICAMVEV